MKTLAFLLVLLPTLASAATWNVSVTWTRSTGPALASEQVLYGGATQCTVTPPAVTTCAFTTTALGQNVTVRSLNAQGAFSETAPILVSDIPAPATGVLLNVTYVGP